MIFLTYMSKKITEPRKYDAIHHWIRVHYGKATKCVGKNCRGVSTNYQWALKKGKDYAWDIDSFIQLCASCHTLYDLTKETRENMHTNSYYNKRTHCRNGHEFSLENTCLRKKKTVYGLMDWRECRTCRSINKKRYRERLQAARNPKQI